MIFVSRPELRLPREARLRIEEEKARARTFYSAPEDVRRRERFHFAAVSRTPEVRAALADLFHKKCSFCETRATAVSLDLHYLRPRHGVVRHDGVLLPDHYWWLASEWGNLYVSCAMCGRPTRGDGKGSRFPLVDEATRAEVGVPYERVIAQETPLLLDPCNDRPEEHLAFTLNGMVVSETERGNATISNFSLNREPLVAARKHLAGSMALLADAIKQTLRRPATRGDAEIAIGGLVAFGSADQEYAGAARQFAVHFGQTVGFETPFTERRSFASLAPEQGRRTTEQFVRRQESFSLATASAADDSTYREVTRRVERVELRNIRAIRTLDIDLAASESEHAPWCVFLGENGSGKSTVLQAVALALVGEDEARRLDLRPARLLRDGARKGVISVTVSGLAQPRVVRITRSGIDFSDAAEPQMPVAGYGETRLPPYTDLPPAEGGRAGRVEGMFRPARTLVDTTQALLALDAAQFDYVARSFAELFAVDTQWLQRDAGEVWVIEGGARRSIGALSTGYQSLVASVVDLLELLLRFWPRPDEAEGLVLLDELGAHLHPRWRIRIVQGLRQMLPGVQFIASTHEPLCLRGLEKNEVVLMQRAGDEAIATTDLPSPRDLRVDQLLTSRHFGLNTTLDPDLDAAFQTYYDLLSRRATLSPAEEADRRRLAGELSRHGILGHTRRDQLAYEAIDQFLADEQAARDSGRRHTVDLQERAEVLRKVGDLWRFANVAEDDGAQD